MALTSTVTEGAFAQRRQRDWEALDALLLRAKSSGLKRLGPADVARLPALYRDVCADLARAQAARYSAPLVEYLQQLTASAHTVLYGAHARGRVFAGLGLASMRRAFEAFPRAVRRHNRAMLIAFLLFFVPFFLGLGASFVDHDFAYRIVPESMLRPLTEAYVKGFDEGRAAGDDAMMAGFYVNNNVGIALRCFALGIFFGLGSAFYLVENGLSIGAIVGYVATHGGGDNILTFIVGHGSFELGAIVIAGGAGLAMGWSVVAPGDRTRLASLQAVSRDLIVIVFGAAIMLLMAAAIEGFWSGSSIPSLVKRGVGVLLFLLVSAYIVFVGRGSPDADPTEEEERRWI